MERNRQINDFYEQQQAILEQAAGKPYRAIRDMVALLRNATRQTSVHFDIGATHFSMHLDATPMLWSKLQASWDRIPEEGRLGLIDAVQSGVDALVRDALLPVIARDAGICLVEADPKNMLAPLSVDPSPALISAIDVLQSTVSETSEQGSVRRLTQLINQQEFITSAVPNDCVPALQALVREFPEYTAEVRNLYRAWIAIATDLFTTLREAASHIQSQEEYQRFLVELHMALWDRVQTECESSNPSPGFRDLVTQIALSSVSQALAIARVLEHPDADAFFPMMPENVRSHEDLSLEEHQELEERYGVAARRWNELLVSWTAMEGVISAKVLEHPALIQCSASVIQSLQDSAQGLLWLANLHRDADRTFIVNRSEVSEDDLDLERIPRFSAIVLGKTIFTNGNEAGDADADGVYGHRRIVRRVAYDPCAVPELYVNHSSQDTQAQPLHCWMCLPDTGISPLKSLIPFHVICGEQKSFTTSRLLDFTQSLERCSRAAIQNIAADDPELVEHFGEIATAGQSLLVFHDPQFYAVLAPDVLTKGCLAECAHLNRGVETAIEMMCAANDHVPGAQGVLDHPRLVSWTANFNALKEKADDRGRRQMQRIKQYFQAKRMWSADEVTEIMSAAKITITNKHKHWKVVGSQGSFPLPSAPLKDGEWRANFVAGMILSVGDLDALEQWMHST